MIITIADITSSVALAGFVAHADAETVYVWLGNGRGALLVQSDDRQEVVISTLGPGAKFYDLVTLGDVGSALTLLASVTSKPLH